MIQKSFSKSTCSLGWDTRGSVSFPVFEVREMGVEKMKKKTLPKSGELEDTALPTWELFVTLDKSFTPLCSPPGSASFFFKGPDAK